MKKQMKVPRGTARAKRREGIPEQGTDARKAWDHNHRTPGLVLLTKEGKQV